MKKIKFYTRLALKIRVEFFCLISNDSREHFFFFWTGVVYYVSPGYSWEKIYLCGQQDVVHEIWEKICSIRNKQVEMSRCGVMTETSQSNSIPDSPCLLAGWSCRTSEWWTPTSPMTQSVDCLAQKHDNLSLIFYTYLKIQLCQCIHMISEWEKWTQVDSVACGQLP